MREQATCVRPVRLSDAADLHRHCYPQQAQEAVTDYVRWCLSQRRNGHIIRLVAEVDGKAVANGQLAIYRDKSELGSLIVAGTHRRRGIGGALLRALIDAARERGVQDLEIAAHPDADWVQAWYRRLGFVQRREHTFPGDERVLVMRMSL